MDRIEEKLPKGKAAAAAGILLLVALAHLLRLGQHLHGQAARLYSGYFSDVVIPVGMYFLLVLMRDPRLACFKDWRLRAVTVFAVASAAEVLQAFGVPLLGRTYDPLDFAAYATGVLLAVVIDRLLLDRLLPRP